MKSLGTLKGSLKPLYRGAPYSPYSPHSHICAHFSLFSCRYQVCCKGPGGFGRLFKFPSGLRDS